MDSVIPEGIRCPRVFSSTVLKGLENKFPTDFVKSLSKLPPVPPMATFPGCSTLLGMSLIFIPYFNLAISMPGQELTFLMMLLLKMHKACSVPKCLSLLNELLLLS